jgi:hypothetical protein
MFEIFFAFILLKFSCIFLFRKFFLESFSFFLKKVCV